MAWQGCRERWSILPNLMRLINRLTMFAMPATTPLSTDLLIAENLFCFWELVGRCSKTLQVEEDYSFINLLQSDWPRRIFRLRQNIEASSIAILTEKMQTGVLPHRITLAEYDAAIPLLENAGLVQVFSQKGMAIQLNDAQLLEPSDVKFIQVKTQVDAARFAMVASTSFGYWVAPTMIGSLVGQSSVVMLLGLVDGSEACCGLAFFDSSGHAGLHMIGTLPEYRGRGLARTITQRLMAECQEREAYLCVLHASPAGAPVYERLGFQSYGKIVTYAALGNK